MRNPLRRIAFVGEPDRAVAESLREYGYRVDAVATDSIVGLARDLHRLKPTVLHARKGHLKASVVARLVGVPLVIQAGREDVSQLTAQAARLAARTLTGAASVREALVQAGAPSSTTCVLRSLIDVAADSRAAAIFPPMLDPAIRWVVAATPCDGPDRGVQDLLLAFATLARTRPRLKLLIAGDGPDARRLRLQAEEGGLRGRVVIHPLSLAQLPSVFSRAAAVVGPSRSGSSPDAIPEALAMGAPVVATALGHHPTWIREGRTGWLVPPRAPVALAARLAQNIDDPNMAKRVGACAQEAAIDVAQPRAAAQELARCYAAVGVPERVPALYLPTQVRALSRA